MDELSEPHAANGEQPAAGANGEQFAADAADKMSNASKQMLDFMFGTQKAILGEMVFVGNETLDRARTETHLLTEFVSKMAGAHSVKDVKSMFAECSQHQIDFIRRDSDRLFKHGEHVIETATKLFKNRPAA